ncbi:DUF885 domain-containing protein [Shewanella sp. AS1]|uniref:DUF885 domain-containing protein n=1 Tax=Shewanella sp. AS1 TaxID=2907626 RepID=UPI001F441DE0|nr:DUF885 domain-containing protein [Shewanella sp. AS1]MCE9678038.1 DUF885 domain-containing protein [Shewanella sp. AS1]
MALTTKRSLTALALSFILTHPAQANGNAPVLNSSTAVATVKQDATEQESAKANQLFETLFMENVMASPRMQTQLGIKVDYDKWDDIGKAADEAELERNKEQLSRLQQIDPKQLDPQTQLSYDLLLQALNDSIDDYQWRLYSYPVNQMYGGHSMIPSFLINQHQIANIDDAKAYISRLNGVPKYLKQLQGALEERAQAGIIAPKFVFAYVKSDSRNIIHGAPFTAEQDSAIWADFKRKIEQLKLDSSEKDALLAQAKQALTSQVKPAYDGLISYLDTLEQRADTRDGVWKFKEGETFYNNALERTTTTKMSADEIHQLGLNEVARIHQEMRAIMDKVGFKGDLQAFFKFMREDKQFYYPSTETGKNQYLLDAKALINTMSSRLDEVFNVKPEAGIVVKAVEPFREKSAGKAFYNAPSPDGSRPGIYYANLYDMEAMPKYQMEALAYHEGIPGHHMQIAIAQELKDIPKFRRFGGYTAYIEGWGLYSEYLPKEMGLYEDPYADFGRLAMELWRSCRLVVDTGIHAKKWTREQGIEYYVNNTPNAKSDAIKMVERHIVMPSQATAYKVGMLKILQLRQQAQSIMGDKFDLGEFHTLLLKNGPLPLNTLEEQILTWANQA